MHSKTTVQLITISRARDDLGDYTETETRKQVFAEARSVGQKEFYEAQAAGSKPDGKFIIWWDEYDGQQELENDGKRYRIIRTYKNGDELEITCEGLVNDGGSEAS